MAGVIFLVYIYYFWLIMRGQASVFEVAIIKNLAAWMIEKGALVKQYLWAMLFLSFTIELLYLVLTFLVFTNPVILFFTIFLAGFECLHLLVIGMNFIKFFQGEIVIKHLLNWRVERSSAVLLFTHATLVMLAMMVI